MSAGVCATCTLPDGPPGFRGSHQGPATPARGSGYLLGQALSRLGWCGQGCREGPWALHEGVPVAGVPLSTVSWRECVCVPIPVHVRPPALEPLCQLHPAISQTGLGSSAYCWAARVPANAKAPQLTPSPQCTTRDCRTSWRRFVTPGGRSAPCGRSTGRSFAAQPRRPSASARSSWPRSWRSCGRRSRCGGGGPPGRGGWGRWEPARP